MNIPLALVFLVLFAILFFVFLAKYKEAVRLKNAKIYTAVIPDNYYDYMTDNDEMDDPQTYSRVTYTEYGKVLNVEYVTCGFNKAEELLNREDLSRFYQVFGIDPRCMNNRESMRFSAYRDSWKKFI